MKITRHPIIDGLTIVDGFITETEERALVRRLKRDYAKPSGEGCDLPECLGAGFTDYFPCQSVEFRASIRTALLVVERAREAGFAPRTNLKVGALRYQRGQGLGQHIDALGPICIVNLASEIEFCMERGGERVVIPTSRRTMLVLDGAAVHEWSHGVLPVPGERLALQFHPWPAFRSAAISLPSVREAAR